MTSSSLLSGINKRKTKMTDEEKGFALGIAVAVGTITWGFDDPVACGEVLGAAGLRYSDYKRAGATDYDLSAIRKVMREEGLKL